MLQPVRTKFRKAFKGRIMETLLNGKTKLRTIWLKSNRTRENYRKTNEAARVALTRYMKRTGKVWTRIFPNMPVSKKPTEVRMGKGKVLQNITHVELSQVELFLKLTEW